MAHYLIDSDVLIWVLRNRQETVDLLRHLSEETGEPLACSALSILEIWAGVKATEEHKTRLFLEAFEVFPVDAVIARGAAERLRAFKRSKEPREWVDAVIAATAMEHRLTLVTYNQKDYPYAGIRLYPV